MSAERHRLGFNQDERPYIFTEDYVAFRVKDENALLPDYLYISFEGGFGSEDVLCVPLAELGHARAKLPAAFDGLLELRELLARHVDRVVSAFIFNRFHRIRRKSSPCCRFLHKFSGPPRNIARPRKAVF